MQLKLRNRGKPESGSQLVQLVVEAEQVRQGEEQPTQVEFIRNLVASMQDRHVDDEVQVPQGDRQGMQAASVESG